MGDEERTVVRQLKESLVTFELPQPEAAGFDEVLLERVELEDAVRERVELCTMGGLRMS